MSDDIDKAQAADEVNTQDALERQRAIAKATPHVIPTGECRNPRCGESFGADMMRLYCGPRCEQEHALFLRRA